MFKKSRRKIVASIMSVLVLLWIGTLAVIYTASYLEMAEQNRGMLKEHAERYILQQPSDITPPQNLNLIRGNRIIQICQPFSFLHFIRLP